MADFIEGTLVKTTSGGFDPLNPVELFLTVDVTPTTTIKIFDGGVTEAIPISHNRVATGGSYRFLLGLMMEDIQRAPFITPSRWQGHPSVPLWEGQVTDIQWTAPEQGYLCAFNGLKGSTWVVIRTPIGLAVTEPSTFRKVSVQVGDHVRWRQVRFDLLAVWA